MAAPVLPKHPLPKPAHSRVHEVMFTSSPAPRSRLRPPPLRLYITLLRTWTFISKRKYLIKPPLSFLYTYFTSHSGPLTLSEQHTFDRRCIFERAYQALDEHFLHFMYPTASVGVGVAGHQQEFWQERHSDCKFCIIFVGVWRPDSRYICAVSFHKMGLGLSSDGDDANSSILHLCFRPWWWTRPCEALLFQIRLWRRMLEAL